MRRLQIMILIGAGVASAAMSFAVVNDDASIVLHAVPYDVLNTCSTPENAGFDCSNPANTVVGQGEWIDVYVYVYASDEIAAAALSFSWDASWSLVTWRNGCTSNEVGAQFPSAGVGSLTVAFDCVTAGGLQPLGWLTVVAGNAGTFLSVVQHTHNPTGTEILGCQFQGTDVLSVSGSIGVDTPGVDGCALGGGSFFGGFTGGY